MYGTKPPISIAGRRINTCLQAVGHKVEMAFDPGGYF